MKKSSGVLLAALAVATLWTVAPAAAAPIGSSRMLQNTVEPSVETVRYRRGYGPAIGLGIAGALIGGAIILVLGVMSLLGRGFGGATGLSERTFNPGMGGSYLFGLTFAVGWSACVGPILGVILTLAFQTATVWQGMMLLFIYTLGLGLPLMIVSTFFGRMSRQSAFWRALRGKGWQWDTSVFVVALVWALAIWRIVAAAAQYAIDNFAFLSGVTYSPVLEWGILVLLLLGAALWTITSSESRRTTIHLHTTQLISGALFVLLGLLMLEGQMGLVNGALVRWSAVVDERMLQLQDALLSGLSR